MQGVSSETDWKQAGGANLDFGVEKQGQGCYNETMRLKSLGLSVLLIASLVLGTGITAAATEADDEQGNEEETSEDADEDDEDLTDEERAEKEAEEERERQRQEAYDMPVQSNEIPGWPQGPGSYAQSAIVMEAGTGAILYAKNIDEHHYPASITKVLTALVALEYGHLSDTVTFSHDSVAFLEPGDSSIGLDEGDQITLEQALYAMLLASANEAAYAVAENVGQSMGHDYDWFIEEMNETCKSLGGYNSSFVNTNGLHDENHYTCARDMALIGSELFKYPEFFNIVQTLEYTIPESDTVEEHTFQQKDKMLHPDNSNYYEYAVGGKTGYTSNSGTTLITMADNGETQLVCVLLQTFSGYAYPDTTELFEYAFNNFTKVWVADEERPEDIEEFLDADGEDDTGYVMLPKGVQFSDLDMEIIREDGVGNREATLEYTYEGNLVGTAHALLSDTYMETQTAAINAEEVESPAQDDEQAQEDEWPEWLENPVFLGICAAVILALAILVIVLVSRRGRKRRDRRKQ